MARSEARTLEIRAKLVDLLTKPLGGIEGSFVRFAKRAAGSVQNLLGTVFNLKTSVIGLAASLVSLTTIKAFGERADELLKLSQSTGDAVENLSELQAAFELAGVKADGFSTVLRALLNRSREATDGNTEAADSFREIGISIGDLERLGPSQVFEKMAAGVERFGTEQERAAALSRLLPKQFLDLLPILGRGLRSFQAQVKEARDSGATVTESQAKVAERLNDSLTKVEISIGSVSRALIEQFGPEAIALFEKLAKAINNNREGVVAFAQAIATGIAKAFDLASDAVIGFTGLVETFVPDSLISPKLVERANELQRTIDGIKFSGAAQLFPDAKKELDAARAELEEINRQLSIGVSGRLRELKTNLAKEISEAAGSIRVDAGAAPPISDDQAANVLGLPTPEQAAHVAAEIEKAMRAQGITSIQQFESTFRPPKAKGLGDQESERTTEAPLKRLQAQADAVQRLAGLAPGIDELNEKLRDSQAAVFGKEIQDAANAGLISWNGMIEAMEKYRQESLRLKGQIGTGDFLGSFNDEAKQAIANWTDFSAAGKQAADTIVSGGLDGITNAISETAIGLDGSSQAWRRFGLSVVSDLSKIITKLLVIRTLQAAFGITLETGGVVQGDMGTPKKFAMGGVATGPTLALFGEGRNREAFVPLPDNRSIPVTLNGGRAGDETHVHLHMGFVDSRDGKRWLAEHGDEIGAIVKDQLERNRGGGLKATVQRTSR